MEDQPEPEEPKRPEMAFTNVLSNPEQREAYQKEVDNHRNAFVDKLPESEQAKFKAVEQALCNLSEAGVMCLLLPLMPYDLNYFKIDNLGFVTEEVRRYATMFYHNINNHCERDADGKLTPEGQIQLSYFNTCCVSTFLHMIHGFFPRPATPSEVANAIFRFDRDSYLWRNDGVLPPEAQAIVDKNGPVYL
jgi:hypothetical protein